MSTLSEIFERNNIPVIIKDDVLKKDDKIIIFPEVGEEGLSMLGTIKNNILTVECRTGMEGNYIDFGNVDELDDSKIKMFMKDYNHMKSCISTLKSMLENGTINKKAYFNEI